MDPFDIRKYLEMASRRKYWIIIPFLLTILAGLSYTLIVPRIYEAETLILVHQQKVPEDYVRSIVSSRVSNRLRTITQQVTSRTNLERVIAKYGLYSDDGDLNIDEKVKQFRKRIRIDVSTGTREEDPSAFTIHFQGKDPRTVMDVTNALASNFITENLKIRESQAIGTSGFLTDELHSVERRLKQKEEELKEYRESYMGGLPQQLDANLRILERLQEQLYQLGDDLRDTENRKIVIQTQITEQSESRPQLQASSGAPEPERRDLQSLKNTLASLEAKYTDRHPDIIRLKETIANMEEERSESPEVDTALRRQMQDIELEIANLKAEIKETHAQINGYQKKVAETPKREQELFSLDRDYENLKDSYNSLLTRKLEADIAMNMEKKQKGEQFMVLDPAKRPSKPIKPYMPKILLLTLTLGLALGVGLAYLAEMMDTSYRTPEEVENELGLPVLMSMPIRYTEKELRTQKTIGILKAASVSVGFILSAAGIIFATKGIDPTIKYAQDFLTNLGVL